MENMAILKEIIKEYNKYTFYPASNNRNFAVSGHGMIILNSDNYKNPDAHFLFSILHEIGHCETYKKGQPQILREFLATKWAIEHCKQYGIRLNNFQKDEWQDYIYSFSKVKDKSKYQLDWSPMKGEEYATYN